MTKNSIALRSVSAAAIVGLSFGIGAPVVMAQTTSTAAATPLPSTINQTTGNLTIHKMANPTSTIAPTGTVQNASGTPLANVGFTTFKINGIDLNTNEGLALAASIKPTDFTYDVNTKTVKYNGTVAGITATAVGPEQKTDASGLITQTNISIGAYFVVESSPAPGYSPAAPFIAFVPMTNATADDPRTTENEALTAGTTWNYDVHAYPKNYENKTVKKVEDTNQQVGEDIAFTIIGGVPANLDPTNGLTKFIFVDDLDETKIAYKETYSLDGGATQLKPTIDVLDANDVKIGSLAYPGDFTVTVDPKNQKLTATLTDTGLAKFNTSYKTTGKKLALTFGAEVKQVGELVNTSSVITNNGSGSGDTTTDSDPTKSYWAAVKINKVDGASGSSLAGAEFAVYGSLDATCDATDTVDANRISTKTGDASGTMTDTWTTGADGTVVINGLHVNDWADNVTADAQQYKAYCLVETKSPQGYELLSKPIQLTLNKTDATNFTGATTDPAVKAAVTGAYELTATVKNLKDTTPQLPLTGGTGIGILAAIGAALVGAGAWFARRNSKKA